MGYKTTKSVLLFGQVLNIDCSDFFFDIRIRSSFTIPRSFSKMTDFLKNLYLVLFGQVLNIDCSGFFIDISNTLVVYNT